MAATKKIEEIKKSMYKIKTINEGIKISEAVSRRMYLAPQQRKQTERNLNLKVMKRIILVNNIIKELIKVEENIESHSDRIKKPEFSSNEFRHPLNFLEDLIAYLEQIPIEYRTIDTILDCLYGDANSWAMIFKERWRNVEDFYKDFLEQFWGRVEQSRLKREIACGVWDEKQESLAQHFASLVNQAKWLPRQIPEEELTFDIMCHFPRHIQDAWALSNQSTILEAITFLKQRDGEKMPVCNSTSTEIEIRN